MFELDYKLDRAFAIPGWMSERDLDILCEFASKSKIIFEIGTYQGKSCCAMAENSPEDTKIYAIDPWNYYIAPDIKSDIITMGKFFTFLHDYIKSGKVIPIKKTWEMFIPEQKADFIFIDGDHLYDSVRFDIKKALKWINPGGIIAGHDYGAEFTGVTKAVDEIFGNKFQVRELIWWTRA